MPILLWIMSSSSLAGDLSISAATSLTDAFKEIVQNYKIQYPGSKVALNFGSSGALLQQISMGAPVDVFASADQETMDTAQKKGLIRSSDRRNFAGNTLVLIVHADSTMAITSIKELSKPTIKRVAISNPASVPVGRYTKLVLEGEKIWTMIAPKMISTQNVRQTLTYIARGEVETGFVYYTEAAINKDKVKIALEIALPTGVAISYPIAKIAGSSRTKAASQFIDLVMSPIGQSILTKYGFQKP